MGIYYKNNSTARTTRKKVKISNPVTVSEKKTSSPAEVPPASPSPVRRQPRHTDILSHLPDKQQQDAAALSTLLDAQQQNTRALITLLDAQQKSTETLLSQPEGQQQHADMLLPMLDEQQKNIKALLIMLDEQQRHTKTLLGDLPEKRKVSRPLSIEIQDVCKQFGTFQAVKHLSLRVRQGEIFGLLGPNGSGKTTTINMISGLSAPTSGKIHVLGYDVHTQGRKVRQLLGCVPQETALFEELSAWNNMEYHADLFNVPRGEVHARITKMLELVQLLDRKDKRVKTFSGGMKRRLALARALLHDPQLVYLDEPTLGVDVQSRRALWDYILSLREQGKTVLITTNYLEEAQELCDRIAIIDHGQLVEVDTPQRLKQRYGGRVIELELSNALQSLEDFQQLQGVKDVKQEGTRLAVTVEGEQDCLPQIINLVARQGDVLKIALREPTLDEVFLQITGKTLRD